MTDLHARLQRLRRPAEVALGVPGLERLEREMLGEEHAVPDDFLPLKARLERLVAAQKRGEPAGLDERGFGHAGALAQQATL